MPQIKGMLASHYTGRLNAMCEDLRTDIQFILNDLNPFQSHLILFEEGFAHITNETATGLILEDGEICLTTEGTNYPLAELEAVELIQVLEILQNKTYEFLAE